MLAKLKNKLKSKQGITLVELLVTIALMAMVTGLTIQLAHSFLQSYSIVQARWRTQNAAQQVMQYFRLQNESLSNSASISLFYTETEQPVADYEDPTDMQGVPSTGNDTYAYIYSQPASDPELGDVIYVLERGEGKTPVNLTEYLIDEEVPLDIKFSVSVVPQEVFRGEATTDAEGNTTVPYSYGGGEDAYLPTTVDVTISTPESIGGNYTLTTSFTMNNMMQNQRVNYEGGTPCRVAASGIGIAGWDDPDLECPVSTSLYPYATKSANILRYVSAQSFLESQNTNGADLNVQGAGLCFSNLVMADSPIGWQVKGALRDFRDNVLAKTDLGNQIIDKYYNEWSPALVAAAEENPAVKTLGKLVLIPASVVALFIAD